jgi:hypothetical protein
MSLSGQAGAVVCVYLCCANSGDLVRFRTFLLQALLALVKKHQVPFHASSVTSVKSSNRSETI